VTLTDIGADYKPRSVAAPFTTTTDEDNAIEPRTKGESQHEDYQDTVERVYPETVYSSIHRNVEFNGERYTAIGYWMTYIHDPKPDDEGWLINRAAHTGDQEVVFVLVDS
jgi:hypothetical protein